MRDIWSDSGVPSEKGLRTAASLAEVPVTFPFAYSAEIGIDSGAK
jgi:hypothetical protein